VVMLDYWLFFSLCLTGISVLAWILWQTCLQQTTHFLRQEKQTTNIVWRLLLYQSLRWSANAFVPDTRLDSDEELRKYLGLFDKLFNLDTVLQGTLPPKLSKEEALNEYFETTAPEFTLLHSAKGSLHFPLTPKGQPVKEEHFYVQPLLVEELVHKNKDTKVVLEVGSGKGFNLIYLAERNPDISFRGVDITPLHVQIAEARSRHLANITFEEGSFYDLHMIPTGSIDVAAAVECSCYADTPEKLAKFWGELRRVLKPGGHAIVWEYLRADDWESFSEPRRQAMRVVEIASVINSFCTETEYLNYAENAGFCIASDIDLSEEVVPGCLRLGKMSILLWKFCLWTRPLNLQRWFETYNTAFVLFLPFLWKMGVMKYRQVSLRTK